MTDVEQTLAERGARYGDFTDHAELAQSLQDTMRGVPGWQRLTPTKRQALTVIADKIARILTGDPEYTDNWHDIQGYAKLAEDRCADTSTEDMFCADRMEQALERGDAIAQGNYAALDAAAAQRIVEYRNLVSGVDTRTTAEKGYENGN